MRSVSSQSCRILALTRNSRLSSSITHTWKDSGAFLPLVNDWSAPDSTVRGSSELSACIGRVLAYCSKARRRAVKARKSLTQRQVRQAHRASSRLSCTQNYADLRVRGGLLGHLDNVRLEHVVESRARPCHGQEAQQQRRPQHDSNFANLFLGTTNFDKFYARVGQAAKKNA